MGSEMCIRDRVNIISGKAKALQKRIQQEGDNSKADILLTVDAGNLNRAKEANLLKKINSSKLNSLVPLFLRIRKVIGTVCLLDLEL